MVLFLGMSNVLAYNGPSEPRKSLTLSDVVHEISGAESAVSETIKQATADEGSLDEQILTDVTIQNASKIGSEGVVMATIESQIALEMERLDGLYALHFDLIGRMAALNRTRHLCAFYTQPRDGLRWVAQCDSFASMARGQLLPQAYNGSASSFNLNTLSNDAILELHAACAETAAAQHHIEEWIGGSIDLQVCVNATESSQADEVQVALEESTGSIRDANLALAQLKASLEAEVYRAQLVMEHEERAVDDVGVKLSSQVNIQVTRAKVDSDLNRLIRLFGIPSQADAAAHK